MLSRLLPAHLDNDFRGYQAAIWIFALITAFKLALGLVHVFSADGGAQTMSHIPLDSYAAGAAQNVVGIFARLGLEQLLLGALFVIVLLRYRAMIPLMYLLLAIEQFGRRGILTISAIERAVEIDGITDALLINWGLMAALAIGFALSLATPVKSKSQGSGPS